MTCNVDDLKYKGYNNTLNYHHYEVKLSHGTVEDLVPVTTAAEVNSAVALKILKDRGIIASTTSNIGLALLALLVAEGAWIAVQDNGCGVTLECYMVNVGTPTPVIPLHYVSSQ